jgi:hypothetical protein
MFSPVYSQHSRKSRAHVELGVLAIALSNLVCAERGNSLHCEVAGNCGADVVARRRLRAAFEPVLRDVGRGLGVEIDIRASDALDGRRGGGQCEAGKEERDECELHI